MTSIRKIKKRLKAIRPRTYTFSSLRPKQVFFPVPDNAMVTCMMLERGDTTAKWNALNTAHGIKENT